MLCATLCRSMRHALHASPRRKRSLLRHLHATRQRLLRLHVVAAWSSKANAMANVSRVQDVCVRHGDALRDAADQLAYLHGELGGLQARRSVNSSVHSVSADELPAWNNMRNTQKGRLLTADDQWCFIGTNMPPRNVLATCSTAGMYSDSLHQMHPTMRCHSNSTLQPSANRRADSVEAALCICPCRLPSTTCPRRRRCWRRGRTRCCPP